jgi:hypothetical protein
MTEENIRDGSLPKATNARLNLGVPRLL